MSLCTHAYLFVYLYGLKVYICIHVCLFVYMYVYSCICVLYLYARTHICRYICMYACVYCSFKPICLACETSCSQLISSLSRRAPRISPSPRLVYLKCFHLVLIARETSPLRSKFRYSSMLTCRGSWLEPPMEALRPTYYHDIDHSVPGVLSGLHRGELTL